MGTNNNPLWKQLIAEKYGLEQSEWHTKYSKQPYGYSIWKGINKYTELFKSNCIFRLGDGTRISFWIDIWVGDQPLFQRFPAVYGVCATKNHTISQMYNVNAEIWELGITRRVHDNVISEIATLLHLLETNGVTPSSSADVRLWKDGHQAGEFTFKKCYQWLVTRNIVEENQTECVHPKIIWSKLWPAKVSFFLWLATKNKVLTQDKLIKRRWRDWANHCYLCINDEETSRHLLLHCSTAIYIWNFFKVEFHLNWVLPHSIHTALSTWPCSSIRSRKSLVIKALPVAILWNLWKERNRRAFKNKSSTTAKIIQSIKHIIAYWLYLQPEFQKISLKQFMINWKTVVFEPP
ncbi:uncharacterized protein LOC113278957 [Papaver somniferum]|uniref:uncharacterized protein LOC113278957 n=1 Tax=Papaver somniferum TaxID=3469 RepID=UPI000E6F6827|nr:uncharacterized protein LOC113278957 [Papaver somniferum]